MKIGVIHDYADVFRRSSAARRLAGHDIKVHTGTEKGPAELVEILAGCEAAVFTQQRVAFPRAAIERLPALKFISQTGRNAYHIDLAAYTERGIEIGRAHV